MQEKILEENEKLRKWTSAFLKVCMVMITMRISLNIYAMLFQYGSGGWGPDDSVFHAGAVALILGAVVILINFKKEYFHQSSKKKLTLILIPLILITVFLSISTFTIAILGFYGILSIIFLIFTI